MTLALTLGVLPLSDDERYGSHTSSSINSLYNPFFVPVYHNSSYIVWLAAPLGKNGTLQYEFQGGTLLEALLLASDALVMGERCKQQFQGSSMVDPVNCEVGRPISAARPLQRTLASQQTHKKTLSIGR